jgi:perosamine synthetase
MDDLALLGGKPVLRGPLPVYRSMGAAELEAVAAVVRSGCLSGFYGSWGEQYLGGPLVRAFEEAWRHRFGVPYAISVNSATSGLFAAVGAAGVGPGDEVIVPPYTMSATAMAPLVYGAIPVFVDIEPETFCLDPSAVRRAVTSRTRAIIAVNLFGHPAQLGELQRFAHAHDLILIEDNAQGPLAREGEALAGTVGDIGVFSLNYHKHIHTGEGGMCVTRDPLLAQRLQLIRNHGENVVEQLGIEDIANLVGFNYRLTELCAAVGIEQLRTIDEHVGRRETAGESLSAAVQGLEGLTAPVVRPGCRHVYYLWALKLDVGSLGVDRELFSRALAAEGFPHFKGYVQPLYRLPIFRQRLAFGRSGYPFHLSGARYEECVCPVAERLYAKELLCFEPCMYSLDGAALDLLGEALRKVHRHRHELARRCSSLTEMAAPQAAVSSPAPSP